MCVQYYCKCLSSSTIDLVSRLVSTYSVQIFFTFHCKYTHSSHCTEGDICLNEKKSKSNHCAIMKSRIVKLVGICDAIVFQIYTLHQVRNTCFLYFKLKYIFTSCKPRSYLGKFKSIWFMK